MQTKVKKSNGFPCFKCRVFLTFKLFLWKTNTKNWSQIVRTCCFSAILQSGTTRPVRKSIQPFWTSREPVAWPWCNLVASLRRPYYASMNSHSPLGLISRQWDAVDWACVLCDRLFHIYRPSRSANLHQCACPFYSSRAGGFFFGKTSHQPGLSAPPQLKFGSLRLLVFFQS